MKLLYSTTGGESSYATQLRALLSEARTSVRIVAHRIDAVFVSLYADQLCRLAARGVQVQLLLSNAHVDAAADALAGLRRALPLLELRVAANLHAKVFIVDGEHLLLGSANLSGDSFGRGSDRDDGVHNWTHPNFDLGVLLSQPGLADEALALFIAHWEQATEWK